MLLCGSQGATYILEGKRVGNIYYFQRWIQAIQKFYQLVDSRILTIEGAGAGRGMAAGLVALQEDRFLQELRRVWI